MTIRTRFLQWRGRKSDNRGSSLSIVLIVMALLMILVSVMMSVTMVNYRMKTTNRNVQADFYSAESSLAEIRLGLAEDASVASNEAYSTILERFNQYTPDQRGKAYWERFLENFKNEAKIEEVSGKNCYKIAHIEGFLKECPYDDHTKSGAKLLTQDGVQNIVQLDENKRTITLKNIIVAFYDVQGYMTQIQTDIVIKCPPMDFSMVSSMPTLQNYVLVADQSLKVADNATVTVEGDAFVGTTDMAVIGSTLKFQKSSDTKGRGLLVVGDNLRVDGQSKMEISDMEVWATNLLVNGGTVTTNDDTAMYISNDVLLNNGAVGIPTVILKGELYAYGNVQSAMKAYTDLYGRDDQILKDPAQYSSSLIVNGHGMAGEPGQATLDLSGLSVLKVSGNTYVSHKKGLDAFDPVTSSSATAQSTLDLIASLKGGIQNDVLMGESIAARTSQIAYLIPAECVAPSNPSGGINPIPLNRYEVLADTNGAIEIDYEKSCTSLGGKSLKDFGVTSYQMEAHQLTNATNVNSMIYLFCRFDSADNAQKYYNQYAQKGGTRLEGYLDTTKVKIELPSAMLDANGNLKAPNSDEELKFYLNGTVLAESNQSKVLIDSSSFKAQVDDKILAANRAEEVTCHKNYAALRYKLAGGYNNTTEGDLNNYFNSLSSADKTAILSGGAKLNLAPYKNLVKKLVFLEGPTKGEDLTDILYYVSEEGYTAVVVNNATFTIDNALLGTYDKLRVVIASGDVNVETSNFEGVILAGGNVNVKNSATIKSESAGVRKALMATDSNGHHAYEHLVNGEIYCVSGDGSGNVSAKPTGSRSILDYVNYQNWMKQ